MNLRTAFRRAPTIDRAGDQRRRQRLVARTRYELVPMKGVDEAALELRSRRARVRDVLAGQGRRRDP